MKERKVAIIAMTVVVLSWMWVLTARAQDVPRLTKEDLRGMLGQADVVVIDVRANIDWIGSGLRIKGAVREDPRKLSSWMSKYSKDKTLVFYCS